MQHQLHPRFYKITLGLLLNPQYNQHVSRGGTTR